MSCWSVNCSNFRSEIFPVKNRTKWQTINTYFALTTHLLSIQATTSWKMLMNNTIKAQTLIGNHTRNYRCQLLASLALNMSCSFSQSMRWIESRWVDKRWAGESQVRILSQQTIWNWKSKSIFIYSVANGLLFCPIEQQLPTHDSVLIPFWSCDGLHD